MLIRGLGIEGKYELNAETMEENENGSWSLAFPDHQKFEGYFSRNCRLHKKKYDWVGAGEQLFTSGNRTWADLFSPKEIRGEIKNNFTGENCTGDFLWRWML